jgi:uncharacterized protein (TIGR02246 family)
MADKQAQPIDHRSQTEIRELIARWAKAVRELDLAGIRADHDPDILMFDVPRPFQSRGLDAYMDTWQLFFSSNPERPIPFHFEDIEITVGSEVAFATAKGRCVDVHRNGRREPLEFRLTMGLKKIDGKWRILHEHHSVPAS